MKKPFYTLNTKIKSNTEYNKESHVIYSRCSRCSENDEKCNQIHGYIYRIKITNITDFGEDIIIEPSEKPKESILFQIL